MNPKHIKPIMQVFSGILLVAMMAGLAPGEVHPAYALNSAPVITEGVNVPINMDEDGVPTAFSLTLHATDADGADTLTWSISGAAANGTATASGTGLSKDIGYTPTANYYGSDFFMVQVSDGTDTDTIMVSVIIMSINDLPVITEGATAPVTMSEDGAPTAFSLTLNATDPDLLTTFTWSISSVALHGTATATGTGAAKAIGYTPTANYNGSDSFIVQVSDGTVVDTITVNMTINSVNDAPVITEGDTAPVTMSEDGTPTAFSLTLNATDIEVDTLTWSISTAASHGTATASGTGLSMVIGYTPTANYNGSDSFIVQVSDGTAVDTITVNMTINSVNDAPVITEGDTAPVTMSEDSTPTAFSLTLNATDIDSGTLTWSISTAASHGTATASGTGLSMVIGYTPTANYNGSDSFIVQVWDGTAVDTITVNMTINSVNDTPVITEGATAPATMSEDGTPTAFSLTLNATDIEVDTLTWSISTAASHGTATASGTGLSMVIGYTPTANYNGSDSFIVQVSDGTAVDTITVNMTINSVNDAPVITEGDTAPVTMSEDGTPTAFSLTLNATDIDSGTLTWSISTAASHGTATASGTGLSMVIGYTPTANYNGSDSFIVQVSDGTAVDTITVNMTINSVNDAPVITEGDTAPVTMSEDGTPTAFSLTLNATDIEVDTLTWSISTAASHGTATASGTGLSKIVSYTPTTNYNGSDSFIVQVSDGTAVDTITVNVTITSINDLPVITEGATTPVTISEDGAPTAFSLTLNATDNDPADTLTWSISTGALHGTATASGTGLSKVIGYTPTANYSGSDSFIVQVSDGTAVDTITVNVTISSVNDAPVITEGATAPVTMSEDGAPTAFSLTLNATDLELDTITWSISTAALHGTATASGTGLSKVIGYTPTVAYNGSDSFIVQVSDGAATDTITVNVTISSVNNLPVITEGATAPVTMSEDGAPTAFSLTLNATDLDVGTTFTWSISSAASHGTATATGTGAAKVIGYIPTSNYNGSDSFVVQVSDGTAADTITVNVTITDDPAKAITSFNFTSPEATGVITESTHTILVTVPFGTDVTALVANFTTTGASIKIGAVVQTSGTTANNFTSPLTYTVTAANASTQTYIVTVTIAPSSAKSITSFRFVTPPAKGVMTGPAGTIIKVTVPFGTNVTALVPSFSTTGASVKIGAVTQVSGITSVNFTNPVTYTVTAVNASTKTYSVTVTVAGNPAKDITAFSFPRQAATGVFNGNDIAITVPFGTNLRTLIATFTTTGSMVRIGAATQISGTTKTNFSNPVIYTVIAGDGSKQTYRVKVTIAPKIIKYITAFSFTNPVATGVITEPKQTIAVTVPFGTDVTALVASFTTNDASPMVGGTIQISGTTPNNFSGTVSYTLSDTKVYKVTVKVAASPAKDMTAFSFSKQAAIGVISGTNIAVTVPSGTNVKTLIARFSTTGASVKVGSLKQVSGTSKNDFTNPVLYRVIAADGSSKIYTVSVTVMPKSTSKDITAFSFTSPAATGVITGTNIAVTVPFGTNVNSLVASFTTTGASVKIGASVQTSGTTSNNFTSPLTYRVTAADASTQDYIVTVTVAANPAKDIIAFSFTSPSATGVITGTNIVLLVPFGTSPFGLVANFTTTGGSVNVGAMTQISGTTANNFTSPVTYRVTAADASTKDYIITVIVAPN